MDQAPFLGSYDTGWDHAPWEDEPKFSSDELAVLLDRSIPAAVAAHRVGCVERDVRRLRLHHEKRSSSTP
ncbi:hypothetical protein [Mycobacterium sp. NPDC050853]|uniref:hypothetical protein n=1 Tax=Mycobacterium sp. NPDC050853 TaxID=3155160 RepID=UPI0034067DA0